jgi:two-component system, OmpR family, sensor kinase
MTGAGIRWRFTLWVSALLITAVGITFVIVYRDTSSHLTTQIEHDLGGEAAQLAQSLQIVGGDGSRQAVLAGAQRYVTAQPFRSTSSLLFVLVPGTTPVSNHPEVFAGSHPDNDETAREQAVENALSAQMRNPNVGFSTRRLPDVGPVRLLERRVTAGGLPVVVGAGEPLTAVTRAQRGVVQSFLLAGALGALAVLLGSYLVGARFTAPLRRMARVAARVDAGDLEPRMDVATRRRDEIGVLATSFNHMLQRLDDGFRTQREFIADASHELRTPLTVIQGQLEVLAHRGNPDEEDVRRVQRLVGFEIERMRRLVDDLLLLTQAERPDFLRVESFDLEVFINQLWDGATLISERNFELGPVPPGRLRGDPDRLAQAIRNLVGNAIEHTEPGTGLVRMEVDFAPPEEIRIAIIDDGPGIPTDELPRIFERFHRAAASRAVRSAGAGLGLAIVRAIAEAHDGSARAANRVDGGARFELRLPGFRPAADADADADAAAWLPSGLKAR